MKFLKLAYYRIKGLITRKAVERAMDDEMRLHLDLLADEYEQSGMSRTDAQRAARRRFGNVSDIKERARDIHGAGLLGDLLQDLRYAQRTFRRSPVVFAVIVLSLALGIGANTAVFSAINGLFLKTLPVDQPEQLVRFKWSGRNDMAIRTSDWGYSPDDAQGRPVHSCFSYSAFQEFSRSNQTLDGILASAPFGQVSVVVDRQAETASALLVSGSYFPTLGLRAHRGRIINPADDTPSAAPVVMISHAYWNRRFAANPTVIGTLATVNNISVAIIGVAPADFYGVQQLGDSLPDVLLPLAVDSLLAGGGRWRQERSWLLQVMGRLKPGMTAAQVHANLDGVFHGISQSSQDPKRTGTGELHVDSGRRGIYDTDPSAARSVRILSLAVAFVLILVCANIANLLLTRAAARQHEISIRLSLGARRLRLIRQLLTETVLIALAGGALSIIIARACQTLLPSALGQTSGLDWRVLVFTATLSVFTGITFGLAPALRATAMNLSGNLNEHTRSITGSRTLLSKSLIVAQVTISVVLLIGAALLIRTLQNLRNVELGFNPRDLLVFRLNPALNGYDSARTIAIYEKVTEEIEQVPRVRAVTLSGKRLLSDEFSTTTIARPGRDNLGGEENRVHMSAVAPTFFEVMQIPLVAGRQFTRFDNRVDGPKLAIINEAAARKFFSGENPLGKTFQWNTFGAQLKLTRLEFEIVGITKDTRHSNLRDAAPPTIYIPYLQLPVSGVTFEVRTAGNPATLLPEIRSAVARVDPTLPVMEPLTQMEQMETRLADERAFAFSYSLLGALAAILASIGLFGTMSYNVVRRTNEIGIRLAIGAQRRAVVRMVLQESLSLVLFGIALGVVGAQVASRFIGSLLYGLEPTDPYTYVIVSWLMVTVSLFAAYLPARRASRIDPMIALRYD
jgi:predicted permease